MLVIAWQYLTGRCVATDFADRERAEWPPHPDRVFQALVASWGERGEDPEERKALEWLEALSYPQLAVPEIHDEPKPVKVYVPVNDIESNQKVYGDPMLAMLPEQRTKKERYFPSIRVGDGICSLVWEEFEASASLHALLEQICSGVTRIGHSTSLVRCWVAKELPAPITHVPATESRRRDMALRVPECGRLKSLRDHRKGILENRTSDILPPRARQVGYVFAQAIAEISQGDFASPLLVLRQVGGQRFSLRQTLDMTQAFRHALIPIAQTISQELREFISGHASDGSPLKGIPHLAYLPLAFTGDSYADGHLLGMALAFPKGINTSLEDDVYKCLGKLMPNGQLRLVFGAKGEMILEVEEQLNRLYNLRSETWCKSSNTWATATPIVMDRMQNSRRSDPDGWACDQIAKMCELQKLPRPSQVIIRPVSYLEGTPTIKEFPAILRNNGTSHRMVHAHITWDDAIIGPLVLGAGRFKGYGFCKPCGEWDGSKC